MSERPAPKTRRNAGVPRDLEHVFSQGARTRSHRYFRDVQAFIFPVLIAILAQALVYSLVFFRTGRTDWNSTGFSILALAFVPIFAAFTLCAFRRHQAPIIVTCGVVAIYFSFAVTLLSAFRIALSYWGLAATLPVTLLVIGYANIRFHANNSGRVGLIATNATALAGRMLDGADVALITHPATNISAFDTILIDPGQHYSEQWSDFLARCYLEGVDILPWNRYLEIKMGRTDVNSFDITHLAYSPSQILYARAKRFFDLAAIVVSLPLTLPVAAATALYILMRDGGPVMFVQHRRGLGGKPFRLYKFRTMRKGTSGGATMATDKRIIPGCRLVRKLRLDELPQLYNILRGEMSLIGPRPEAVDLVRWYRREIEQWDYRTLVLPGITGWAQVNSGYTSNPEEARVKLSFDLFYVKHLSFDLDLLILFRTVRTVLFGTGAR